MCLSPSPSSGKPTNVLVDHFVRKRRASLHYQGEPPFTSLVPLQHRNSTNRCHCSSQHLNNHQTSSHRIPGPKTMKQTKRSRLGCETYHDFQTIQSCQWWKRMQCTVVVGSLHVSRNSCFVGLMRRWSIPHILCQDMIRARYKRRRKWFCSGEPLGAPCDATVALFWTGPPVVGTMAATTRHTTTESMISMVKASE